MMNNILKEHFLNPKNMGKIDNPTYQSIAKSDLCNDIVKMMAVINNGMIDDIKVEVFGCGYSIAGASLFTEIVSGRDIKNIMDYIDKELDGIIRDIPEKHHTCIKLSKKAFQIIYDDLVTGE